MDNDNSFLHGNYEDKYNTKHPIKKLLMGGFITSFIKCFENNQFDNDISICEIGCGEGELLKILHEMFPQAMLSACDISAIEIEKAKENCSDFDVNFSVQNAQNLEQYPSLQFDIVVCCEVLEHLNDPNAGFEEIDRISKQLVVLSVPNEPLWRLLNMVRGKYLLQFGNTPGHVNHWSIRQFRRIIEKQFGKRIMLSQYPIPWQMLKINKS